MGSVIGDDSQQIFYIDEISDWQGFHALVSEWNPLLSNSNVESYFLTHEWLSIWIRHFSSESTPFILTARDKKTDELLGIAPLVIVKKSKASGLIIKQLSFMGNGLLEIDHLDFIIYKDNEDEISEVFAEVIVQQKSRWDKIFFDGLVSSSQVLQKLLTNSSVNHSLIYEESCPYLPLPETWELLKQKLGKNLRYNLGRYKRKLEKDYPGSVFYQTVTTENALVSIMANLYQLHLNIEHKNIFQNKDVEEFNNEISKHALESDQLRLYSLKVQGTIIAVLYCFQYKDRILFYQSGYDKEWKHYSPGRLLMAYAIKNSISEKAKEFDFLRGNEDYKNSWTSDYRSEIRVHIPSSFKGHISQVPMRVRKNLKNIFKRQ